MPINAARFRHTAFTIDSLVIDDSRRKTCYLVRLKSALERKKDGETKRDGETEKEGETSKGE